MTDALKPGQTTAPNIRDVARLAGVSIATVSRCINNSGYVSAANRQRVTQAIAALDFTPSHSARSLSTHRSQTVGFMVVSIAHPFWGEVARGIQDVATAAGYILSICSTDGAPAAQMAALRALHGHRADAIIAAWPGAPEADRYLERLASAGAVVVSIGRQLVHPAIDTIISDNRGGAQAAMAHLLGLGHRRIAYLDGPAGLRDARFDVYREALTASGLAFDEQLVVPAELTLDGGGRAMRVLLERRPRPTAVFCVDDLVALGAHQAARQAGCRIPADLSIVGFDDDIYARLVEPPLTTVAKPSFDIGRLAAERALLRLRAGLPGSDGAPVPREVIRLRCDLVVRGSTGPPPLSLTED